MRISHKGLYALKALVVLARREGQGAVKVREMAWAGGVPGTSLELIMLELKTVGIVESTRGSKGGYQLHRSPSAIQLSDVIRLIDGPLAPMGDADRLRSLIARDTRHRALYKMFLDVRDEVARIFDRTSLADIAKEPALRPRCQTLIHQKRGSKILPQR